MPSPHSLLRRSVFFGKIISRLKPWNLFASLCYTRVCAKWSVDQIYFYGNLNDFIIIIAFAAKCPGYIFSCPVSIKPMDKLCLIQNQIIFEKWKYDSVVIFIKRKYLNYSGTLFLQMKKCSFYVITVVLCYIKC